MSRLLLMVAIIVVVAVAVGSLRPRRRFSAPTAVGALPSHLDRSGFSRPDAAWLVVVFSADSCLVCAEVISWAQGIESDTVAVQVAEAERDAELHRVHAIDSVPATILVDQEGSVHAGLLGPLSPAGKSQILQAVSGNSTQA